jgi:hypothetical protein
MTADAGKHSSASVGPGDGFQTAGTNFVPSNPNMNRPQQNGDNPAIAQTIEVTGTIGSFGLKGAW